VRRLKIAQLGALALDSSTKPMVKVLTMMTAEIAKALPYLNQSGIHTMPQLKIGASMPFTHANCAIVKRTIVATLCAMAALADRGWGDVSGEETKLIFLVCEDTHALEAINTRIKDLRPSLTALTPLLNDIVNSGDTENALLPGFLKVVEESSAVPKEFTAYEIRVACLGGEDGGATDLLREPGCASLLKSLQLAFLGSLNSNSLPGHRVSVSADDAVHGGGPVFEEQCPAMQEAMIRYALAEYLGGKSAFDRADGNSAQAQLAQIIASVNRGRRDALAKLKTAELPAPKFSDMPETVTDEELEEAYEAFNGRYVSSRAASCRWCLLTRVCVLICVQQTRLD
jgi:hypothetical protein